MSAAPQPTETSEMRESSRQRIFLLAVRQSLLVLIGAIEDYLGLERSRTPQHVQRNGR